MLHALPRPEAKNLAVDDLLGRVLRGRIRVPRFQRGIRWDAGDVRRLLDSIRRGFPIGTLLVWKRSAPAPAEHLEIGPLAIDAAETSDAWWVVDGQQRVTALAGALLHPPVDFEAPPSIFEFYFDFDRDDFVRRPVRSLPREAWLPLSELTDSQRLLQWLRDKGPLIGREAESRAIALGKALREYQIPLVVVESDSDEILRNIFERINNAGRRLNQDEIFHALHAAKPGEEPAGFEELATGLEDLQFGDPRDLPLRQCVLAIRDIDPTRQVADISREPAVWKGAFGDAAQALRRVIVFLKSDASIPSTLLLPYRFPVVPLAKFFYLFPEPAARSRDLLARWVWRGAAGGTLSGEAPEMRRAFRAVGGNEELSVQQLLVQVPAQEPDLNFSVKFDLRTAPARLGALTLVAAEPRSLDTGARLDTSQLLLTLERDSFARLLARPRREHPGAVARFGNRLLHPGPEGAPLQAAVLAAASRVPEALRSHLVTPDALEALKAGRFEDFLDYREAHIFDCQRGVIASHARWGETDRPSLRSIAVED